jgi:hypothetical protein
MCRRRSRIGLADEPQNRARDTEAEGQVMGDSFAEESNTTTTNN